MTFVSCRSSLGSARFQTCPLGDDAKLDELPQVDDQSARDGHDPDLAHASAALGETPDETAPNAPEGTPA